MVLLTHAPVGTFRPFDGFFHYWPATFKQVLTHFLLIQNSQYALCNARHELEARVARWLLLTCDRLDGNTIPITHDQLSMMLGVRRAGITETLAALEAKGALKRARGEVEIVDRGILETRACECYRAVRDHLANFLEVRQD